MDKSEIISQIHDTYKDKLKCECDFEINQWWWYEFKGHRWFEVENENELYKKIAQQLSNQKKSLTISEIKKIMQSPELLDSFHDSSFSLKLDSNPDLLGFENGVYDLSKQVFREGKPDDYVSLTVGYDYLNNVNNVNNINNVNYSSTKEKKEISEIKDYFDKTFEKPDEAIDIIAKIISGKQNENIILTNNTYESGIIELLHKLLGQYAKILSLSLLTKYVNPSPEIASLKGVRLVSLEKDKKISCGNFKKLMSEDKTIVKPLYCPPYSFTPQFKFLINENQIIDYDSRITNYFQYITCQSKTIRLNFENYKQVLMRMLIEINKKK